MKNNLDPINKTGKLHWHAVAFTDSNYRDYAIIAPTPEHAQALAARFTGIKIKKNTVQPVIVRPRKIINHA